MIMLDENIYGTLNQARGIVGRSLKGFGMPHRPTASTAVLAKHAQVAFQNMAEKIASKWWDGRSAY